MTTTDDELRELRDRVRQLENDISMIVLRVSENEALNNGRMEGISVRFDLVERELLARTDPRLWSGQ